jgi:hypothetical protein
MALNVLSKKVNVGSELCEVVVDEGYTDMWRKHLNGQSSTPVPATQPSNQNQNTAAQAWRNGIVNPSDIVNPEARRWSGSTAMSNDLTGEDFSTSHVPHPICKFYNYLKFPF